MEYTADQYDEFGKSRLASLFKQFNVSYYFTAYQYDRVDVYFGRSSVGEIKYRNKNYGKYIIQEDKFKALKSVPVQNRYYIVVFNADVWFWSVNTIQTFEPETFIIDGKKKKVRNLPIQAADFHFELGVDGIWRLISFG